MDRNIMHDKMKENAIKILKKWKEKIMKQLIKLQKKDIDRRIELDFLMLKNSIEQKINAYGNLALIVLTKFGEAFNMLNKEQGINTYKEPEPEAKQE